MQSCPGAGLGTNDAKCDDIDKCVYVYGKYCIQAHIYANINTCKYVQEQETNDAMCYEKHAHST